MKRAILGLSILVMGAYADVCTEFQYVALVDPNSKRYKEVNFDAHLNRFYVDKKSIKYNKKSQTITVWRLNYTKHIEGVGFMQAFLRYNLLNNKLLNERLIAYKCSGQILFDGKDVKWMRIVPGSIDESVFKYAKSYLGIK